MAYESHIPVNVITGFLGSGKTTLLQRMLRSDRLTNTAVLVNEFGEVGLDHMLLETIDEETVVLQSGCICCTIRDDLSQAIRQLYDKRQRGQVPLFDRVAIETTGLADPAPIVFTLMADPMLRHHFRLGNVLTTVDALNATTQLSEMPEAVKQVAVADRLIITKTDIARPEPVLALRQSLREINPTAPLIEGAAPDIDADKLLTSDLYDPKAKTAEVQQWLADEGRKAAVHEHDADHHDVTRHADTINTFTVTVAQPLDWTAFGLWLTMLLHRHGEDVLRVKAMLNVVDVPTPVVIHGVQHVVHPPLHLESWPTDDRRSRIVFIVRALDQTIIERSLAAFNALANVTV